VLGVVVSRVRADKVGELRRWMAELTDRRDEVLESFRREGMHQERAFLIEVAEVPLLIYVMDADDLDAAGRHTELQICRSTATMPE
jgi:hypothetical protein